MQQQTYKRISRFIKINSRFFIVIFILKIIFVISFLTIVGKNAASDNDKHTAFHKYLRNLFKERNNNDINNNNYGYDNATNVDADELIWSNETVELFQDQLGLTLYKSDDETKIKCEGFLLSALYGSEDAENLENFYEALWQFFSLDALERVTIICDDSGKKLTLRAVVTERIKFHLEELFEGLSSL